MPRKKNANNIPIVDLPEDMVLRKIRKHADEASSIRYVITDKIKSKQKEQKQIYTKSNAPEKHARTRNGAL